MTGLLLVDVVELAFMDNDAALFPVDLHLVIKRPVPDNLPRLIERFLASA